MTNEPKYIGDNAYSILKSDALNMFKKGKYSTIPFIIMIMILLNIVILLLFYQCEEATLNKSLPTSLFFLIFCSFYLIINIPILVFNDVLNHLYTKSKFKAEENSDAFFYALTNFKIIWKSFGYNLLILCFIFFTMATLLSFFDNFIENSQVVATASNQEIIKRKIYTLCSIYTGFLTIQYILFNDILYRKDNNKFTLLNMHLVYLNQRFFKMSLAESIIFTKQGIEKNKDLFQILDSNRLEPVLFLLPIVNLVIQIYYVFLYHAAWQRIYNNQNGITAKEEIKIREYNKNTVMN